MPDERGRQVSGREWALEAAVFVAALEGLLLLAVVLARSGRAGTVAAIVLALKLAFCWGALRRGAGSFLALVLYEMAAVLFAAVATGTAIALRVVVIAAAVSVLVLLARSSPLFPSPTLPRR